VGLYHDGLDIAAGRRPAEEEGLLRDVALTLGSALDLRDVMGRLAGLVLDTVAVERCSIVLLERGTLTPAVSRARDNDERLWDVFRSMPAIDVEAEHWRLLRSGSPVVLDDARRSDIVPREWVDLFNLRGLALVPLLAEGMPCGVMAVEWPGDAPLSASEVGILEAIGRYAGVAVCTKRLQERLTTKTRTLDHLIDVARDLNASPSLAVLLERICNEFEQLLGTSHCSVNLLDADDPVRSRTVASHGEWFTRRDTTATGTLTAVPPEAVSDEAGVWRVASGPVVYDVSDIADDLVAPLDVSTAVLFPLFGPEGLIGTVLAGFPGEAPGIDELEVGQALAEFAATAVRLTTVTP
jgi:GAF domain-containing protein